MTQVASQTSRWTLTRIITLSAIALIAFLILLVVGAVILVRIDTPITVAMFAYIRDVLSVFLVTQCIIIVACLGILILQVARFFNLLRSEVKPITEDVKEATQAIRTSAEFVGRRAVSPTIRLQAFFSAFSTFTREAFRFSRLFKRTPKE